MTGRYTTPATSIRATHNQREYVGKLLARGHYMGWGAKGSERTGPMWRPLFKAIGNEPDMNPLTGQVDFPTCDEFVDSLTTTQASNLINFMLKENG